MGQRLAREFAKNWPIIGIAVVLWLAVVVLRTPTLGIDPSRVVAIIISSGSMVVVGMQIERFRNAKELDKEDDE